MLKGAAKASSTPPWSIAPPCSFALIAAPPGSQEVGSVPSQPSLAKLPGDQWNIPCCKLSVFVSVFCSVKSPSHTCSNPPFPTRKGNAVIQTEPPSLSEVFLSGRSDHTSSGMQYVAGQQTSENLGLLPPGNFVLLSKMSLCFSPVSSGLIICFLITIHCKVISNLFLLYCRSQDHPKCWQFILHRTTSPPNHTYEQILLSSYHICCAGILHD